MQIICLDDQLNHGKELMGEYNSTLVFWTKKWVRYSVLVWLHQVYVSDKKSATNEKIKCLNLLLLNLATCAIRIYKI